MAVLDLVVELGGSVSLSVKDIIHGGEVVRSVGEIKRGVEKNNVRKR